MQKVRKTSKYSHTCRKAAGLAMLLVLAVVLGGCGGAMGGGGGMLGSGGGMMGGPLMGPMMGGLGGSMGSSWG